MSGKDVTHRNQRPDTEQDGAAQTGDAMPADAAAQADPAAPADGAAHQPPIALGRDGEPQSPARLGGGSWLAAAGRAIGEFRTGSLQDRAAALTYYGVQAIFPALLVLISLLGLLGQSATQPLMTNLTKAAPSAVRQIIGNAVTSLQSSHAAAGLLAIVGIVLGVWSASSYVAAFMRAANAIYDVPEGRPAWKTMPLRLGITLLLIVLMVASALMVVVTGGLARHVGQVIGAGPALVTTWDIAKWPVLLIIFIVMLTVLYWASPNAKRRLRWVRPGATIAVVVWVIASGLFALYVANFGHYNKVYGSIAAVIIFLIWLWISNVAILFGAQFNAELERGRAMAAGAPPGAEPFVELRDTRKLRAKRRRSSRRHHRTA